MIKQIKKLLAGSAREPSAEADSAPSGHDCCAMKIEAIPDRDEPSTLAAESTSENGRTREPG